MVAGNDHVAQAAEQHGRSRQHRADQQGFTRRQSFELRPEDQRDAGDAAYAAEPDATRQRCSKEHARQRHIDQWHGRITHRDQPGDDVKLGKVDQHIGRRKIQYAEKHEPRLH